MAITAAELPHFIEAVNAAEDGGVPIEHAEWHVHYMHRLAREMYARGLFTDEAGLEAAKRQQSE